MEEKDCSPSNRERELGLDRRETGLFYPTVGEDMGEVSSSHPWGLNWAHPGRETRAGIVFPHPTRNVGDTQCPTLRGLLPWCCLGQVPFRGRGGAWQHELVREEHSCLTNGLHSGRELPCREAASAGYGLNASKAEARTKGYRSAGPGEESPSPRRWGRPQRASIPAAIVMIQRFSEVRRSC